MQKETGRSAVELLGTLAVMGMLSVVGVSMYTAAMDKSRANTLIQEAQKRAVIVAGQIGFNNQTPTLSEFEPYNKTSAGTFGDVISKGLTNQFGIQVSAVPKSICQNILNTIGDKTPIRRLSHETTPTTPITTCKEEDDFLFVYNNDMTGDDKVEEPRNCRTVNDCKTSCATCEIEEGEETGTCREECEEPTKLCTVDTECNQTNQCMVCDTDAGMCKDGCERVEFLQSNGSQYIDTKKAVGQHTKLSLTFQMTDITSGANGIFGASSDVTLQFLTQINKDGFTFQWTPNTIQYFGLQNTNENEVIFDVPNKIISVESGNLSFSSYTLNYPKGKIMLMSNGHKSVYGKMKIFSCKIYDNKTLVRDFVPVIAPDKKACMFDKVSKGLFCDANGRTFKTNLTQE